MLAFCSYFELTEEVWTIKLNFKVYGQGSKWTFMSCSGRYDWPFRYSWIVNVYHFIFQTVRIKAVHLDFEIPTSINSGSDRDGRSFNSEKTWLNWWSDRHTFFFEVSGFNWIKPDLIPFKVFFVWKTLSICFGFQTKMIFSTQMTLKFEKSLSF